MSVKQHASHRGFFAVHTNAPKSMSAWLKVQAFPVGITLALSRQRRRSLCAGVGEGRWIKTRERRRLTFVSKMGLSMGKPKLNRAPAVERPTPGRAHTSPKVFGKWPLWRRISWRAVLCRVLGLAWELRPPQARAHASG